MQLEYNQICTENSEVEVGKIYLYTEGNLECKVKVLNIQIQPTGIYLSLQVSALPENSPLKLGEILFVFASKHHWGSDIWWRLHDNDLIHFQQESPAIPTGLFHSVRPKVSLITN